MSHFMKFMHLETLREVVRSRRADDLQPLITSSSACFGLRVSLWIRCSSESELRTAEWPAPETSTHILHAVESDDQSPHASFLLPPFSLPSLRRSGDWQCNHQWQVSGKGRMCTTACCTPAGGKVVTVRHSCKKLQHGFGPMVSCHIILVLLSALFSCYCASGRELTVLSIACCCAVECLVSGAC